MEKEELKMKIDKFGIYQKLRKSSVKSVGLPRKPEKLIGKKVFFSIEDRNFIDGAIIKVIRLK